MLSMTDEFARGKEEGRKEGYAKGFNEGQERKNREILALAREAASLHDIRRHLSQCEVKIKMEGEA